MILKKGFGLFFFIFFCVGFYEFIDWKLFVFVFIRACVSRFEKPCYVRVYLFTFETYVTVIVIFWVGITPPPPKTIKEKITETEES